jgi:hypothetical protein
MIFLFIGNRTRTAKPTPRLFIELTILPIAVACIALYLFICIYNGMFQK